MILLKSKAWMLSHKKSAAAILLVILAGAYGAYHLATADSGVPKYVLAAAEKGTVITSVSGTGQVSASNEITLASKASGDITSVNVVAGQQVTAGQLIAAVDATDAYYELESARIQYEELVSVDSGDLDDAKDAVEESEQSLEDAYASARGTLATGSTGLSDAMEDLDGLMSGSGYLSDQISGRSETSRTYRDQAQESYYAAEDALETFINSSRNVTTKTSESEVESAIKDGYDAALLIAQAAKDAKSAVAYIREQDDDTQMKADSAYETVSGLTTSANGSVTDFSSARDSMTSATRALEEAQESLDDIEDGPDTLDLRSQTLALRQKEKAYADHFARAPFAGTIAAVSAKVGEDAGDIATLITDQKIAELSLNEVDASKVAVGQKATLTFDAIDGLTVTGTVAEMDLIGTVEQGVVSYAVKIGFDTDDARIKPSMTVSADIVTDIAQDVLVVPTTAIKTEGDVSYVEVIDGASVTDSQGIESEATPEMIEVSVGLSGDDSVEILSGISEGDIIVTRTIAAGSAKKTTTSSAPSLLGGGSATRTTGSFQGGAPR
jgi:HlyD family secretion protein